MMEWLNALHWRAPWWLMLGFLPALLYVWRRHEINSARLARFADGHLVRRLLQGPAGGGGPGTPFVIAWLLAALALAGPYWSRAGAPTESRGIDLAVIIDISPSMAVADLSPNRLTRVKHELRDFIAQLGGDRLALIAFSANAYPILPLTADREAFLQFADLFDPGLTAKPGSNLGRAMDVAGQLLADSPARSRAALLISDGEFHDAEAAGVAARLREQGIPLFVVGAGTAAGGPVPDGAGHFMRYEDQVVLSRLGRDGLQRLARDSGGHYVELREDDNDWRELIAALRANTQTGRLAAPVAAVDAVPLYIAPLVASLVLFLWAGARRREALAMLFLPLLLAPPPSDAAPWSERQAYEALQQQDYAQARQRYGEINNYRGWLGAGAAAYRLQDWRAALAAFEKAARQAGNDDAKADALYNAGNALAQLKQLEDASARYRAALRLKPQLAQAALNLSLINAARDARSGPREREDAARTPLDLGGEGRDQDESTASGRGNASDTGAAAPPAAQGNPERQRAKRDAAQAAQQGEERQRQSRDAARLEEALALWRDAGARRGGNPVELEALRDNSAAFLQWRFRELDFGPQVQMMEGKPW